MSINKKKTFLVGLHHSSYMYRDGYYSTFMHTQSSLKGRFESGPSFVHTLESKD